MTPTRRRWALALGATSLLLGTLGVTPVAHADEAGDAPVTHTDRGHLSADGYLEVDPLANDTDPDYPGGRDLAVCRVAVADDVPLLVGIAHGVAGTDDQGDPVFRDLLEVRPTSSTIEPGAYQLTYYACDHQYLTPGTVDVTVTPSQHVTAVTVKGRPGVVRFHNPGSHRAQVQYGGPRAHRADGHFALAPKATENVRVQRRTIVWFAMQRTADGYTGYSGSVTGIRLPRHHARPTPDRHTSAATRDAWARSQARLAARASGGSSRPTTAGRAATTARRDQASDAPVTALDRIKIARGRLGTVDVLANDTDPNGDDLTVCRTSVTPDSGIAALPSDRLEFGGGYGYPATPTVVSVSGRATTSGENQLVVSVDRSVKVGSYRITYYACDLDYLTPATVVVKVTPSVDVTAVKGRRAGFVRFHNPSRQRVQVFYAEQGRGSQRSHRFPLAAHATRAVRVSSTSIFWTAQTNQALAGYGVVQHIQQPAAAR